MAIAYRAAWILPIVCPPIREGWVLVENGRVTTVGEGSVPGSAQEVVLGRAVVLPGLVNAHTHLELSWMKGRVPPAERMFDWIRTLMQLRRRVHRDDPFAMGAAVAEARGAGTALVGDVTNTLASVHALAASPLSAQVFYEMLGFRDADPAARVAEVAATVRSAALARLRTSVVPHAPYSVSPALFREIAALAHREQWPTSVHVAESAEEMQLLCSGEGPWRDLLRELGAWDESWAPPGTGPVAYLESFGLLTARTLVVHGVHLDDDGLRRLAAIGATLVTCPRSNVWVGAGAPPISRFYASGARVAVGTDSLASCPDLNLFSELAALRRLAPEVPASRLLHSATRVGAEALGFERDHGAIEPGLRADLLAVTLPDGEVGVEEYLCSGIRPEQVRWVA
jgi:aminodeoxyfutalosine deaminase